MTVFQVTTRTIQPGGPRRRRVSWVRQRTFDVLRYVNSFTIVGGLFALTIVLFHTQWLFILLPVGLSLVIAPSLFRNLKLLLVTAGVAVIFYTVVTLWELLTHPHGLGEIIIITTTLAAAIILEPARVALLTLLDRRFHLRQDATARAIEAFTTSLREEIELDQVRERLLDVTQKLMRPQALGLWVRATADTRQAAVVAAIHTAPAQADTRDTVPASDRRVPDDQAPANDMSAVVPPAEPATIASLATIASDDPFVAYALGHPGTIEVTRLQLDSPLLRDLRASAVEIALPLASQGELLGLLTLGPRQPLRHLMPRPLLFSLLALLLLSLPQFSLYLYDQEYSREDLERLDLLAVQVAPALRVAFIVRQQQTEVRQRERIAQELRTAQQIQHTFLPKEVPALPGWHLSPYYQPAREVGGDFYDFLPLADGRLGLVLGDVTGKGVPAALVMTATRTMLRTTAHETASPGAVLARVNDLLLPDIPAEMFVTCFYAILEPATGRVCYANAGQDLPYMLRADSTVCELRARGMPLGLMPAIDYEERDTTLAPGDTVLFYSDGLVEAHNPAREMFGFPRLAALLTRDTPDGALIAGLLGELAAFTGPGWEQEDDVTLVTLHRTSTLGA